MNFYYPVDPQQIKRERTKARRLRLSSWWQQKINLETCYFCNQKTDRRELTMDHLTPLARGGKSEKLNIVTSCKSCNNEKSTMTPVEYRLK